MAKHIIKKYANRRLYDTETSQSITLQDVRDLVGAGASVQVVEAKSGRDVTRSVLLQIMADQEMLGRPVLSNEFLEAMIRINSNPMRKLTRDYLEHVMTGLESRQHDVEEAWEATLGKSGLDGVASASIEPFQKFQKKMFKLWSETIGPPPLRSTEEDDEQGTATDRNP